VESWEHEWEHGVEKIAVWKEKSRNNGRGWNSSNQGSDVRYSIILLYTKTSSRGTLYYLGGMRDVNQDQ